MPTQVYKGPKFPSYRSMLDNRALLRAAGVKYVYAPHGASLDVFHCHDKEILLAGPAGTGKSLSILNKIHLVLSKYPKSKGFMSRKTRTSMTNSCLDMFDRHVLKPGDRVKLHKQDQVYNYPNGSQLAIIGLDNPERIKSTEWDIGYIQEATECSENDWEMCTSRMRNFVVPYQQLLGDCNPDKPTHWLKKRTEKPDPDNEAKKLTTMMLSFHQDNPVLYDHKRRKWTEKGLVYRSTLDRLSGVRRSRLYLGQWVAAEGMVYEKWDPSVYMLDIQDMPAGWSEWPTYWSVDFGFKHPFVWKEWAEDPDTGILYRVQEIYHTGILVEDHARWIMKLCEGHQRPRAIICDHDLEDRMTLERHTGLLTVPAYKLIQRGIQAVQSRLTPNWRGTGRPGIMYVRDARVRVDPSLKEAGLPTCTEEEFDGYVWDEDQNRTVNSKKDELPVDLNNHGMDSDRYMVAFADDLAIDPSESEDTITLGDEVEVNISPF